MGVIGVVLGSLICAFVLPAAWVGLTSTGLRSSRRDPGSSVSTPPSVASDRTPPAAVIERPRREEQAGRSDWYLSADRRCGWVGPPKPCSIDGHDETVVVARYNKHVHRDAHYPEQTCPRHAFSGISGRLGFLLVDIWAIWDGEGWSTEDVESRFRQSWREQMRRDGLASEHVMDEPLPGSDAVTVRNPYNDFPVAWALQILNPGLTHDEARLLAASTTHAFVGDQGVEELPYTDLRVLRETSEHVRSVWREYHQALVKALSDEDLARTRTLDIGEVRQARARASLGHYRSAHQDYLDRLQAAHDAVVTESTVVGPSYLVQREFVLCNGMDFAIPEGLQAWLHRRPAWTGLDPTMYGEPA